MTSTNFTLTENSPLRTVLVREDTNQPIFRIETPRKVFRPKTVICKIKPGEENSEMLEDSEPPENSSEPPENSELLPENNSSLEDHIPTETDHDDELARIYWHLFGPHRVIFQGRIWTRSQLLPRVGPLKRSFNFTANNVKFKWDMGLGTSPPKLILDDGSETIIAQFHAQPNPFNKRKAYLEITPRGMDILDHVILTFVIVEKTRRDRKR